MPVVRVQIISGRTDAQKRNVAQAITDALAKYMDSPRQGTQVIFEDVLANDWVIGGQTVADREKARRDKGGPS